jgi:hypothetical protein
MFEQYLDADDGTQGGGGTDTSTTTQAGGGNASDGQEARYTQADVERFIKERFDRDNIKGLRDKASKYDQIEAAKQTDAERVATRERALSDREATLTARERSNELRDELQRVVAAERVVLRAPIGDIQRLLDSDRVEWSDDGRPKNVTALFRDLIRNREYLADKRTGSGDGGAGNGQGGPVNMNDLVRQRARG